MSYITILYEAGALIMNQPIQVANRSRIEKILLAGLLLFGLFSNSFISNFMFQMYSEQRSAQNINSIQDLRTTNTPIFFNKADIYNPDVVRGDIK